MKSYLLIQLVSNGRAIWQTKQDVPAEHCRRMTQEELEAVAHASADVLAGVVSTQMIAAGIAERQSAAAQPARAPEPRKKK